MGKIVRGAQVGGEAYVVAVPRAEPGEAMPSNAELDDYFAAATPDVLDLESDAPFDAPVFELPAPEIDWQELRANARAIVDDAAAAGEAILQDAAKRARELVDRANARVASIESEARRHGQEEGERSGRAEIQAQLSASVSNLEALIEATRAQRDKILESAEPEILKLAMAVAERIVHEQISIDQNVVVENVKQALTRLIGREVVTLRVNPADLETIRQHRDAVSSAGDVEHLRIVEDRRVDRGGVVVETEAGTIDAKISTQIQEAKRVLLPEFSPAQAS
ncbi:MAG TPA: FliH/SctL family protein [Verrucomicrobiae bacterium]|nr:FliH/SctL family protein [Verrucomicrobiae bacterium]